MKQKRRGEDETRRHGARASGLRVSANVSQESQKSASVLAPASAPLRVATSPRRNVPVITLLTDFGAADYFVAAMKGVILGINSRAAIVDLSHDIPAQDIAAGAFTLRAAYESFPAGTIHVAVVDPGVGSARRAIVATAGAQVFVGPDNGIFSYVFDQEPDVQIFQLNNERYFRHPVSATFHGRDVFAPVAAALSLGVRPDKLGKRIGDPVVLAGLASEQLGQGRLRGRILHIDHFGNCITNFKHEDLANGVIENQVRIKVGRRVVKSMRQCFSEAAVDDKPAEVFAIWGSAGFLELAAMNRSAAEILKATCGQPIMLLISDD